MLKNHLISKPCLIVHPIMHFRFYFKMNWIDFLLRNLQPTTKLRDNDSIVYVSYFFRVGKEKKKRPFPNCTETTPNWRHVFLFSICFFSWKRKKAKKNTKFLYVKSSAFSINFRFNITTHGVIRMEYQSV